MQPDTLFCHEQGTHRCKYVWGILFTKWSPRMDLWSYAVELSDKHEKPQSKSSCWLATFWAGHISNYFAGLKDHGPFKLANQQVPHMGPQRLQAQCPVPLEFCSASMVKQAGVFCSWAFKQVVYEALHICSSIYPISLANTYKLHKCYHTNGSRASNEHWIGV